MEKRKTTKNEVSLFIAGYKAGIAQWAGMTPERIEELDYTTTEFGNRAKEFLRAYDAGEYDEDGLENIYQLLVE